MNGNAFDIIVVSVSNKSRQSSISPAALASERKDLLLVHFAKPLTRKWSTKPQARDRALTLWVAKAKQLRRHKRRQKSKQFHLRGSLDSMS